MMIMPYSLYICIFTTRFRNFARLETQTLSSHMRMKYTLQVKDTPTIRYSSQVAMLNPLLFASTFSSAFRLFLNYLSASSVPTQCRRGCGKYQMQLKVCTRGFMGGFLGLGILYSSDCLFSKQWKEYTRISLVHDAVIISRFREDWWKIFKLVNGLYLSGSHTVYSSRTLLNLRYLAIAFFTPAVSMQKIKQKPPKRTKVDRCMSPLAPSLTVNSYLSLIKPSSISNLQNCNVLLYSTFTQFLQTVIDSIGTLLVILVVQVFLVLGFTTSTYPLSVPMKMAFSEQTGSYGYYSIGRVSPLILFFSLLFIPFTLMTLMVDSSTSKKDSFFYSIVDYLRSRVPAFFLEFLVFFYYLLRLAVQATNSPKHTTLPQPKWEQSAGRWGFVENSWRCRLSTKMSQLEKQKGYQSLSCLAYYRIRFSFRSGLEICALRTEPGNSIIWCEFFFFNLNENVLAQLIILVANRKMVSTSLFSLNLVLPTSVDFLLFCFYDQKELNLADINNIYIFNNKKSSKNSDPKMKQIRCLRLKPISVDFYNSDDCSPDSCFTSSIEYLTTIYKSGVIKANKQKHLNLSSIIWIEFLVNVADLQNHITVSLATWRDSNSSKNNSFRIQSKATPQAKFTKQFCAWLPIGQLLCIPANKKKKFTFPILSEGQIQGEAEFKMIVVDHEARLQSGRQSGMDWNEKLSQKSEGKKVTAKPSIKEVRKIMKPKLSDTSILITPEMFTKKQSASTSERGSELSGNTNADLSQEQHQNNGEDEREMGLLQKFEQLNRRFDAGSMDHEGSSIWQQQESTGRFIKQMSPHRSPYEIIHEESEEEDRSEVDYY